MTGWVRRRCRASLSYGVAGLLASLAIAPSAAADVPPGFDLFETDPASTHFDFQAGTTEIPAGFFGPGSQPFTGVVAFGGEPLNTFNGLGSGDADTVVRRHATAPLAPPFPATAPPIPIEIVALNLVSVQPITVTYLGGRTELWDVGATVHPPIQPQGQMQIHQDRPEGGTFSSQLPVLPRLTFTRIPDGQTRVLDVPNILGPQLTFNAANVPWRAQGCDLPALRIAGLNEVFCPGFTPERQKQLTLEQAALARHGIYPVQPALEHFKCYALEKQRFRVRAVSLADQFGQRNAKVRTRAELCNPVRKNSERLLNNRAHLQCYGIRGPALNRHVAVRNQFGAQRLLVRRARRLCVPTTKREQGAKFKRIQTPIDHYQCYSVVRQSELLRVGALGKVTLRDQFHRERVTPGNPVRLCAPVAKNQRPIQHLVRHLVCYKIKGGPIAVPVQIKNQFENLFVQTRRPRQLCVPSLKLVL